MRVTFFCPVSKLVKLSVKSLGEMLLTFAKALERVNTIVDATGMPDVEKVETIDIIVTEAHGKALEIIAKYEKDTGELNAR